MCISGLLEALLFATLARDKGTTYLAKGVERGLRRKCRHSPLQPLAVVWAIEFEFRADGHDARGIDVVVGEIVVPFDVVEVHSVGDAGMLIEVTQMAIEVRVIHDSAHVALEMAVIHGVEANERAKEAPIGLENAVSEQVAPFYQTRLQLIERREEFSAGVLIGLLAAGETGPINAVVHTLVKKL